MTTYLVTGGTGLMGRHVVERLARQDDAKVFVLVRARSAARLREQAQRTGNAARIVPIIGDLTVDGLGLTDEDLASLHDVDHLVHVAAVYDLTADEETQQRANVAGTRRVVELAGRIVAGCLHQVRSVVGAGHHHGAFGEDAFDVGQNLPTPYQRTKFAAERLVREMCVVPWRIYRPSVIVGDSTTGEMDKIDGIYYLLPIMATLGGLPGAKLMRLPRLDLGMVNIVPVDWVADATVALLHRPGLDGHTFHLTRPTMQPMIEVLDAWAKAAGAPRFSLPLPRLPLVGRISNGVGSAVTNIDGLTDVTAKVMDKIGIPAESLELGTFASTLTNDATLRELAEAGIGAPPDFPDYADRLYNYWSRHMDELSARRRHPGGPLAERIVMITGASSGIGRAAAIKVAERGGIPLLLARRADELAQVVKEIEAAGGRSYTYPVDLTDAGELEAVAAKILADHDHVDMLVNNAGRSIRRSFESSQDRFHDYERCMNINYYAPVRLMQALVPSMQRRKFGHIVNVSSVGAQAHPPRFSAYVASKAALEGFTRVASSELLGDGITFTTIHMPLVKTAMSAPTKHYESMKGLSPEQAGEMVVRALEKKPATIDTKTGTITQVMAAIAPRLMNTVLHAYFFAFPDSGSADQDISRQEVLSRSALALSRLAPGVHW
jgi:NAD(P)-dependent dehydrogenase (short-subunit alcohol dehydrogenase family)